MSEKANPGAAGQPGIFSLLVPYKGLIVLLLLFALLSNGINLWLPKIIADGIDDYTHNRFDLKATLVQFSVAVVLIFVFGYLQSIIQVYASEKVARDLRTRLSDKISRQSHAFIEKANPSKAADQPDCRYGFDQTFCVPG
jgi:ATP-binding cassette subfamily B protein